MSTRRVLALSVLVLTMAALLVAPAQAADPPRAQPWTTTVARGWGMWIDVYDWSLTHSGGSPAVTLSTIDELADRGVQTLYIQTARSSRADDVTEPARLRAMIDRAHARGMSVVGWYLPTHTDPAEDLRRFEAALALDIDGFALDIESVDVRDVELRNRRLVELARDMRRIAGDRALIATVLSPLALEEIVPDYWPDYPWEELARQFDVIQPMIYHTYRDPGEPYEEMRDPALYIPETVRRIRANTGDPDVLIHVVSGIANEVRSGEIDAVTRASVDLGVMGASMYDVATTRSWMWDRMFAWRGLHEPGGTRFLDVPVGAPLAASVEAFADAGYTVGCNPPHADQFCPRDAVTREQMAQFLARALRLPSASERFVDVASSNHFGPAIGAIQAAGITRGCNPPTNDRFCPTAPVSRGEMAQFIATGFALPEATERFSDVGEGHLFRAAIGAIQGAGITLGCNPPHNTRFCPDDPVTREQAAAFVMRALAHEG